MLSASGPPINLGFVIAPNGPKKSGSIKMMQIIQSHPGNTIFVLANIIYPISITSVLGVSL